MRSQLLASVNPQAIATDFVVAAAKSHQQHVDVNSRYVIFITSPSYGDHDEVRAASLSAIGLRHGFNQPHHAN